MATRIRTRDRGQVVILREALDAPLTQARSWASSDRGADLPALLAHITARWPVEVFFADTKDVLGLDHDHLMTATALRRFWTLVFAAYAFLEEQQARAQAVSGTHATSGDARRLLQRDQQRLLLAWLQEQFRAGASPDEVDDQLAA